MRCCRKDAVGDKKAAEFSSFQSMGETPWPKKVFKQKPASQLQSSANNDVIVNEQVGEGRQQVASQVQSSNDVIGEQNSDVIREGRQKVVAERTQGGNPFLQELINVQKRRSLAVKSEQSVSNHFEMEEIKKMQQRSDQRTLKDFIATKPERGTFVRRPTAQLKMIPIKPPRMKLLQAQRLSTRVSEAAPKKPPRYSLLLKAKMQQDGQASGQFEGTFEETPLVGPGSNTMLG